jgi:hypothetical protein
VGLVSTNVQFTALVSGDPSVTTIVEYAWTYGDGNSESGGAEKQTVTHTYGLGRFDVTLVVKNDLNQYATNSVLQCVKVVGTNAFVVTNNPAAAYPYATWGTATPTMGDAVEVAEKAFDLGAARPMVFVSNGTYNLSVPVVIKKGIVLQGLNGWSNTVLNMNATSYRVVDIETTATNAVVEGLTLQGGNLDWKIGPAGAGARLAAGNLLNCLVWKNRAPQEDYGAGLYLYAGAGVVSNCIVTSNMLCNTSGNYGYAGGGIYMAGGLVTHCTISSNIGGFYPGGGGIYAVGGTIANSRILKNLTPSGGHGAGVYLAGSATLRNCLVAGNETPTNAYGGGIYLNHANARVENCTVVRNQSGMAAVAQASGTVSNTIVYFNSAVAVSNWYGLAWAFGYCDSTPALGGNNIDADPMFLAAGSGYGAGATLGDYDLSPGSPCVNRGAWQPWMASATDLEDRRRVVGPAVDIGAYEAAGMKGAFLIIR